MNAPIKDVKQLTKRGFKYISVGIILLISCELPIILAFIGLGSVGADISALNIPVWLEAVGISVIVVGILILLSVVIMRKRARSEVSEK